MAERNRISESTATLRRSERGALLFGTTIPVGKARVVASNSRSKELSHRIIMYAGNFSPTNRMVMPGWIACKPALEKRVVFYKIVQKASQAR